MATTAPSTQLSRPPGKRRRGWWRYVRLVLIVYLSAMLLVSLLQRWLIFPGMAMTHGADAQLYAPLGTERLSLRLADGSEAAVLFSAARQHGRSVAELRQYPTLIYFYGNAQCMAWALDEVELFRDSGFNVLVGDYPGFGLSGGRACESGCYALADAMWEWTQKSGRVDSSKVVIAGWSLGSGVAVDLASRKPAAGLVTFSAFTSMDEMARKQMPVFPTGLMLEHHFRSLEKMPQVNCPVMLFHGSRDTFVPPEMMPRLASAVRTEATTVWIPSGHNEIIRIGHDAIRSSLAALGERLRKE